MAAYDYRDESGNLLFQVVRFEPKDFRQRRPSPNGDWIWDLKSVRLVLYRLPNLTRHPEETVFLCEGEKDVHALEGLGLLATCNPMGAGKWRANFAQVLAGRDIVIIPDYDAPIDENGNPHFRGQKHAAAVAASLLRHGCQAVSRRRN